MLVDRRVFTIGVRRPAIELPKLSIPRLALNCAPSIAPGERSGKEGVSRCKA